MRQRSQNVLERPYVRACECVVPNQSMPRVHTLADQSERAGDPNIWSAQMLFWASARDVLEKLSLCSIVRGHQSCGLVESLFLGAEVSVFLC